MQEQYPLEGNEFLLFKTPVSFIDHLQEFLGALLTTCTLIVPPLKQLKENMFYIADFLQAYAINRFIAVPSLMRAILPVMQDPLYRRIQSSLKLLVLSGEIFHITLWQKLVDLLPNTVILNFYGSTEVAGDCTFFDCKRLPLILENETPESVPIGGPISNCCVRIVEYGKSEGELYVSGQCIAAGYYSFPAIMPLAHIEERYNFHGLEPQNQYNFRTGDLVRQLQCGDFVFVGRKDRLIKINGQRISLEEIEVTLREHPDLMDAAVVSSEGPEGITMLEAHLVRKLKVDGDTSFCSSIRGWMLSKLPTHMVPTRIYCRETLPMSSSGKVDYTTLSSWTPDMDNVGIKDEEPSNGDLIQNIQKIFSEALTVADISIYDDFFEMGGNSVSAAFASYKLGISMKLLYSFPTPLKLQVELLRMVSSDYHQTTSSHRSLGTKERKLTHFVTSSTSRPFKLKRSTTVLYGVNSGNFSKHLKIDNDFIETKEYEPGTSVSMRWSCAFSRSNSVMHGGEFEEQRLCRPFPLLEIPSRRRGSMHEVWKVYMESCVDASPLIVYTGSDTFLFIGSHSFKFACINANSGSVHWEIKLQGRIECSAAILDDFSQVVVGCYQGNIYFIDFVNGSICWTFQTGCEVKSQPVIDKGRHVVWCGSYDHNLYALDYKTYSCVYKLHCGGSIFSSPAIDEVQAMLFVASTGGQMTAISLREGWPCSIVWVRELEAPVFGSLSIDYSNGNVICCSVDGNVYALDATGSTVWKARTGGPIFGGPCISHHLPSQVLICSRDGSIYSFDLEKGDLLWEHSVGQPITSSAYVDESLLLTSDGSHLSDRLVCICSSSGSIHVLRITMSASEADVKMVKDVEDFARFDLDGDIFSSPVMIGGRIFIGCRDDYVHCIKLDK
ncbi:hypothetical protein Leryth_008162 [Lithospermum erythrorhizon]|nr:hypothetical protein Leryth_008162 [Lithospermum erythrorhizon]